MNLSVPPHPVPTFILPYSPCYRVSSLFIIFKTIFNGSLRMICMPGLKGAIESWRDFVSMFLLSFLDFCATLLSLCYHYSHSFINLESIGHSPRTNRAFSQDVEPVSGFCFIFSRVGTNSNEKTEMQFCPRRSSRRMKRIAVLNRKCFCPYRR